MLNIRELKAVYEKATGHATSNSAVNGFLTRHGWRKMTRPEIGFGVLREDRLFAGAETGFSRVFLALTSPIRSV
jgi:hypothetical protein